MEVKIFRDYKKREPFTNWIKSLKDPITRHRITNRIIRLQLGNFGDYKHIEDEVFELSFDFGAGYRVYFGKQDNTIVILLCGGDKGSQRKDIEKALHYWRDYKEAQE